MRPVGPRRLCRCRTPGCACGREHQPRHRTARGIEHRPVKCRQVTEAALEGSPRHDQVDYRFGAARVRPHRLGHVQHLQVTGPDVDRPAVDVKSRRRARKTRTNRWSMACGKSAPECARNSSLRRVACPEDARAQVVVPDEGGVVEAPVGVDVGPVQDARPRSTRPAWLESRTDGRRSGRYHLGDRGRRWFRCRRDAS